MGNPAGEKIETLFSAEKHPFLDFYVYMQQGANLSIFPNLDKARTIKGFRPAKRFAKKRKIQLWRTC